MQEMQKVAGICLVRRDCPQQCAAEIAHVLALTLDRPRRIGVGDVVMRQRRTCLERTWGPEASEGPAIKIWSRTDCEPITVRDRDEVALFQKRANLGELRSNFVHELPRLRVIVLDLLPGRQGITAVEARGRSAELFSRRFQLALGNPKQRVSRQPKSFLEP
jgi:hypothetical protein